MDRKTDKNSNSSAFTLAEVLITLGIIGVVAAMTIPTLMKTFQDMQYKTAYKKAYSILSQAFMKATSDGDIGDLTGGNSSIGGEANFQALKKQFAIAKDCNNNNLSECWDTTGETFRSDVITSNIPAFIDNSGFAWKLRAFDSSGLAPAVLVDTNGSKKPNKYGQDRFPIAYYGTSGSWSSINGIPVKMAPYPSDILDSVGSGTTDPTGCLSADTHPCYYLKWLYN